MQQSDVLERTERYTVDERPHWSWRTARWLITTLRPDGGWLVLLVVIVLAALPPMALGENRLEELRRIQVALDLIGPMAVVAAWLWLGWRRPPAPIRQHPWRSVGVALAILLTGVVVMSQVLVGWLPGVGELWQAARTNDWGALGQQMLDDLNVMLTRFALWWQGVRAGGAAQDNLIFAAIAGMGFWLAGALVVWLTRFTRQGFLSAAPVLWLTGAMLLYTPTGRGLMLGAVLLAIALHLLLDQATLVRRWQTLGLDFSPGLLFDRVVSALAIVAIVVVVAGLMPNLYYSDLVWGYYRMVEPAEQRLEEFRGRLFPELRGSSRLRGGSGLNGMPNEFMLGAGAALGNKIVMYVRTNDTAGYQDLYYGGGPFESVQPPGHYMRGMTLSEYDGHGWRNPDQTAQINYDANQRWEETEPAARKVLVQSVTMLFSASVLFGAPEQVEPGVSYNAELRAPGDLVAVWSRARNYTMVSSIPAVSEQDLAAAAGWDEERPLPPGYEIHLALPQTITERTRQLAAEIIEGRESPHAKAAAIEAYLRQYEYDLEVDEPPRTVGDVADYFLFDLRRGYCDYYATAFVVLARLAGLPTRFATGYAVGSWDPVEGAWIISEAEAHSWPEVFFPDYGWIPFEPTAGRPMLSRIGLPNTQTASSVPALPTTVETTPVTTPWNWQSLIWLLPLGLLAWLGWGAYGRWQQRREDPWVGLLRWGGRAGRPLGQGETVLEYGHGLASYVVERHSREADTGRVAAREITSLSDAVNQLQYAPTPERSSASERAFAHWQRLRGYLPRLRVR
jgi:transglutaminase-like putative cysteine protease